VGANGNECENRGIELISSGRECAPIDLGDACDWVGCDWMAHGHPVKIATSRECESASGYLGAGSDKEACAASCSDFDAFQLMDENGGDFNCRCCDTVTDGPEKINSGTECANSADWLNIQTGKEIAVVRAECAATCRASGSAVFQIMENDSGDNNCKCCDDPAGNNMWDSSGSNSQASLYYTYTEYVRELAKALGRMNPKRTPPPLTLSLVGTRTP
jgi:hypothetical protein